MNPKLKLMFGAALIGSVAVAAVAATRETPRVEFLNRAAVLESDLPFSEAVRVGRTIYLSGQIGVAPGKMELVAGGIEAESTQTLANIKTILEANGLAMSDVVKCTVMLADIAEWGRFNTVYKTFFEQPYPARSAFGASGLALGARVEVECIAAMAR